MSARRIARELAVILLPQLPKDKAKLSRVDLDSLVGRAVQMLTDYARQCMADANAFLLKSQELITESEINHPENASHADELKPVPVTTGQLRQHIDLLERALNLTSEALDIPHYVLQEGHTDFLFRLVSTCFDNRQAIDEFIGKAKAKWRIERMVSIDRDILRLACAEAFYLSEVPINVCISEAVELSHRFADDRAARFINGVLADLAEEAVKFRRTGQFSVAVEISDQVAEISDQVVDGAELVAESSDQIAESAGQIAEGSGSGSDKPSFDHDNSASDNDNSYVSKTTV